MTTKTYSVRVLRAVHEEHVDIEVEASSPDEAAQQAVAIAEADPESYFGELEAYYRADPSMEPEVIE